MQIPDQPACLLKFPVASVTLQFRDCSSCGQATLLTRFPPLFPKVRHRWCELVVKHKYAKAYEQVERFLQEDQVSVTFPEVGTGWLPFTSPGFSTSLREQIPERVSNN